MRVLEQTERNREATGGRRRGSSRVAGPPQEANAIFEAVVAAVAQSFEKRKGEAVANLYASICADPEVSIADALHYLRRLRDASWRQLVAVRFFEDEDRQKERELIEVATREGDATIHPTLGDELPELAPSLGFTGSKRRAVLFPIRQTYSEAE